jgi:CheY-like chemotaxis protein
MALSFIIVDDSELDCFIAKKIIGHADQEIIVDTFQSAAEALDVLKTQLPNRNPEDKLVLLLDLQMPLMNGFQFVEEFEKLPKETQDKALIVILSSTRNSNDILRIFTYKSVHSLMEKPLTRDKLFTLIRQASAKPLA